MEEHYFEPEPNVIESSTGFAIRVLGRTGMRYTEGSRSVEIDSEVGGTSTPAIAMFKDSIRVWRDPDRPEPVTDSDRDRIVENIRRAFKACGRQLVVQKPFDWSSIAMRRPNNPHG